MRQLKITQRLTHRSDVLNKYLNEVSKCDLLTPDEEYDEFVILRTTDCPKQKIKSRDKIAKANLRFVISVAKQYESGKNLNDFINHGNEGLMIAVDRFDHTRGLKFITYAVWWIRQKILAEIHNYNKKVDLPMNMVQYKGKLDKFITEFMQHHEREPTDQEMMEEFGMNSDQFLSLMDAVLTDVSLDNPLSGEDDTTHGDMLLEREERIIAPLERESIATMLANAIATIPEREQYILNNYFYKGRALDSIADDLKLTKERTRQLKDKGIRKVKKILKVDKSFFGEFF